MTTYAKLVKNLEKKVKDANKEINVVKWLFYNSDFFCGYQNLNTEASLEDINKLEIMVNHYLYDNMPPQYILNKAFFFNYTFYVDDGCFIPRYETEQLVEETLYRIDDRFLNKNIDIADVCCGCGAIGITLKKEVLNSNVFMCDISNSAIEITKKNALNLNADVEVVQGDFIQPILQNSKQFDVIVCNPPYIKNSEKLESIVVDNEPNIALFGGIDGLDFYRIIFKNFDKIIKSHGFMAFEFGYDQRKLLEKLINESLPYKYEFLKDYNNLDRMLFIYKD